MLQSPAKIDSVAANVNGEQIDLNEVLFEMMNERTSVYTEFAEKHQLGEDPLRWEKKYEGKRPISILRERALKNAIRTKIIQIQMKKFGIQADISYSNFNKNFESFTQSRGSANQAVYGPPHLSPSNYYYYVFSNNLIQLREKLAKTGIDSDELYDAWLNKLIQEASIKINNRYVKKLKV